ncbi:MAG: NifB/NifX family molybdenum-iron cluster-binding protein [Desulfuromonadaceae bacterium]
MDVKIAVASSDGIIVDEHFGRARSFRIYRLYDCGYEYLETRENLTPCTGQSYDDTFLVQVASGISDCRGVVAAKISPCAVDAVIMHLMLPFTLPGTVEKAFQSLINSKKFAVRN